jgi:hypothetical protein
MAKASEVGNNFSSPQIYYQNGFFTENNDQRVEAVTVLQQHEFFRLL